jgi:hypothetical protein
MHPIHHHLLKATEKRHVIGTITIVGLFYIGPYLPESITLLVFFAVACMAMTTHAGSLRVALVASLSFLLSLLCLGLRGWKSFAGTPLTFGEAVEVSVVLMVLATLIFGTFTWIRRLLSAEKASMDKVLEACNVYVWIAGTFAFLYTIIGRIDPNAFRCAQLMPLGSTLPTANEWRFDVQHMLFYSFMTQTTLGLGDIVPVTHMARVLTVTQAIIGQFYVAVVLAYILNLWMLDLRRGVEKKNEPKSDSELPRH